MYKIEEYWNSQKCTETQKWDLPPLSPKNLKYPHECSTKWRINQDWNIYSWRGFFILLWITIYALYSDLIIHEINCFQVFTDEVSKGKENDFVECLVFGDKKAVVMTGNMINTCKPNHVNEIVIFSPCFYSFWVCLFNTVKSS